MTGRPKPMLDKFKETDEWGTLYSASLQIALFANRPLPELAAGAIACYRLFMARFGKEVERYSALSMRQPRAFSAKYADVFPTLCQEQGVSLPRYKIFRGKEKLDYLPPVFQTSAYHEFSALQLHLPPTVADNLDDLLSLVSNLAEAFPFRCGYVGYSLCWDDQSADRNPVVPPLIAPLHKRYPGFAWGVARLLADHPLPPVNWLTLLGPEVVDKLGGLARVRKDLEDRAISVEPMGAGICIRAGDAPEIGDRNRGDDLPLYHKVGRYLRDYRGKEYLQLKGFDVDESEAWLARFDS
jgi:Protein of unknown function (DUF3396)